MCLDALVVAEARPPAVGDDRDLAARALQGVDRGVDVALRLDRRVGQLRCGRAHRDRLLAEDEARDVEIMDGHVAEHAARDLEILEPLTSLEEARCAAEICRDLIRRNPALVGLFVAGGGIRGVIEALREQEAFGRIVTVALDLTRPTRMGLIEGVLKLVIAHPLERFCRDRHPGHGRGD